MKRLLLCTALAVLTIAGVFATAVRASDFTISPTTITLTNEPAADVVVTNTGTSPVRLSVHAYAWSQEPNEPEKLVESGKVVYFPEIFVLPAGGTQRIRVGVSGAPTDKEQTYRLILEELPSRAGADATGVTFVGRVDMPVFVPPGNSIAAVRAPNIASLRVAGGEVQAVLANDGTVHISQSNVVFTGTNRQGKVVWSDTKQLFYILANATQAARATIPHSVCLQLESVTIRWSLRDNLDTLTSSTKAPSC